MDVAFVIHLDFNCHTRGILTVGNIAVTFTSPREKVNTKRSTVSKLVVVEDVNRSVLLTSRFLEVQGYGGT
jgi:hypothetical protein